MKLLIISDSHIPSRSRFDIINFLKNKNYDLLIHCGDFDRIATYNSIKNIAGNKLYCVYWNSDDFEIKSKLPEQNILDINGYKAIIKHWHQVYPRWDRSWLLNIALKNNAKILFCWHTHKQEIYKYQEWIFTQTDEIKLYNEKCTYFVNPWSLKDWNFLEINL